MLPELELTTVRGNQDRAVFAPSRVGADSPTRRQVIDALSSSQVDWLASLPLTATVHRRVLLCHGTPKRDDQYLIERVGDDGGVTLASASTLEQQLEVDPGDAVLCGHSHLPRLLALPRGAVVMNPGSVGLPAYADDDPVPYVMEAGSPHARCAVISEANGRWQVDHLAVPHDVDAAATAAARRGRDDWAGWIRTGRAGGRRRA